ncbi:MAG: GNAT family N-acetyltransferase [Cyanobacteria bacterium J06643_13]
MQYYFRLATAVDLRQLDHIYRQNMKPYVERIYAWDSTLFRNNFVASHYQVIEVKGVTAGFLKLVKNDAEIYLAEIQIRDRYQNLGIGSKILKDLMHQTEVSQKRLRLKVIQGNPALKLYQRLGFVVFETSSTHLKLEFNSQAIADA